MWHRTLLLPVRETIADSYHSQHSWYLGWIGQYSSWWVGIFHKKGAVPASMNVLGPFRKA